MATRIEDMVRTDGEREMQISWCSTSGREAISMCTSGNSLRLQKRMTVNKNGFWGLENFWPS